MNWNNFLQQLGLLTALLIPLLLLLHAYIIPTELHLFSWVCLIAFVGLSILMFYTAYQGAMASNKNVFLRTVLGLIGGKMMMCLVLLMFYYFLAQPSSKLFLLPFFLIYLAYTIFETTFLLRLSKINA